MEIENKQEEEQQQNQEQSKLSSQQRKGRIIIRNLVFDIHEKHLRNLLSKFGTVSDISIPLNPSNGRSKGFAFAQFENKNNALKAIKELNQTKFKGRSIVLDLAQAKDLYHKQKEGNNNDNNKNNENQKKEKQQDDDRESDIEIEQDNQEELEDFTDSESEIEANNNNEDSDDEDSEVEEEQQGRQQPQKQKKKEQPKEDLSHTVFIRNISFQTQQSDFEEFFKGFGEFHFAKLVIDKTTGDNKGTGFVKFKDGAIAKKLIQASVDFDQNTNTLDEPIDLELDSRRLICLESIDRNSANEKSAQHEKEQKNKIDIKKVKNLDQLCQIDRHNKRNMRLAKLGTFDVGLAKSDIEKQRRENHLKEKIEKLKNSNLVVSQTRIAFKHLPKKNFDESNLKKMVFDYLEEQDQDSKKNNKKQKIIQQVLLLRDQERNNNSRGIAFIEFVQAETAEKFIKQITADINRFKKDCQGFLPIVEFAIEDIRKIKKYQGIREQRKQQQKDEKEYQAAQKQEQNNNKPNKLDKKKQAQQQQLASKLQLQQILEGESNVNKAQYNECLELLQGVKSRGAKQRLHKKVEAKFDRIIKQQQQQKGGNQQQQQQEQQGKSQEKEIKGVQSISKMKKEKLNKKLEQRKEQIQKQQEEYEQIKENRLKSKKTDQEKLLAKKKQLLLKRKQQEEKKSLKQIQQSIKNKRKAKKQLGETDDLDSTIKQFLNKQQKKAKWDNE